jgi:glutamate synthase (NADPH/NADH) small chain
MMQEQYRQPMPVQAPEARIHNWDEVALGYTQEQAVAEAKRCINCKQPGCAKKCPVEIDINLFVAKIAQGDIEAAVRILKEKNALPAVCGRVCPQEIQCESGCVLRIKKESVAIGRLERFAADYDRAQVQAQGSRAQAARPTGKKVAVVGSGPAGLTAAGDLAKLGYPVTVFESLHALGGVLGYGIPEFRLPKSIVAWEVEGIRALGVEFRTNTLIGRTLTLGDLKAEGFEAVFVGSGAGLPQFMGVPGEDLNGVSSANEFLARVNLMKGYRFPQSDTPVKVGRKVAVVGGGNVAMDAARVARRLGAEVSIVYRRSRAEMPARAEEVEHAEEEGIRFEMLSAPVKVEGEAGRVTGLTVQRMQLGEPDTKGRRKPVPIPGSAATLALDSVIVAIGNRPNPLLPRTVEGLATQSWGGIIVSPAGQTSLPQVFAGGDIVTGGATVIEAMGAGKRAARAMDRFLRGEAV